MSRITVPGFSGLNLISAPQRLEDHQAQVAVDCDFRSGDLRPYYGDKLSTTFTGATTSLGDPSTIYLYDQGQLIRDTGDKDFARSPVFFSDASNDRRVFYSDAALASDDANSYPRTLDNFPSGGTIPSGASLPKRLGVPKPAPLQKSVEAQIRSGEIAFASFYTRPIGNTARTYNTKITTSADLPSSLKTGSQILVTFPGMDPGPYTIALNGTRNIELLNTGLKQIAAGKAGSLDGTTWINMTVGKPLWIQVASGASLGVDVGDQIVLTYKNNATLQGVLSREAIYSVGEVSGNRFTVVNSAGGFPHTGTFSGALAADQKLRYAKLADVGNALDASTTVNLVTGTIVPPALVILHTKQTGEVATWEDAATIDTVRSRAYCVTFVNASGDESEPSQPTDPIDVVPGSPALFPAASLPIASYDETKYPLAAYTQPTKLRIYRTDELGTFRLVTTEEDDANTITWAEATNPAFTFTDSKTDAQLGEPLATTGWAVPVQGIKGLINAPNGVVAGFRGRTIWGTVPYAPYAWPIAHQVATEYEVVGLAPTSSGLVVVTKGMPYILIGDSPANWSMQKLEYPHGCVARRSIVDMGEFAIYASPDGLVAVSGANVQLLTKPVMTREQWQTYLGYVGDKSTLNAAQVEGRYLATYTDSLGAKKGFIYDPQTQSFTDLTLDAVAFCNDLVTDVLLILSKADGKIYGWNQDIAAFKAYKWTSKWFQLPIPELMGVAQIFTTRVDLTGRTLKFVLHGYDNNAAVKIYEISTSTSPDAILGNRPFRIPYVAPGRFTAFQITLEGSIPVGTVMVGRVMDEMKEAP